MSSFLRLGIFSGRRLRWLDPMEHKRGCFVWQVSNQTEFGTPLPYVRRVWTSLQTVWSLSLNYILYLYIIAKSEGQLSVFCQRNVKNNNQKTPQSINQVKLRTCAAKTARLFMRSGLRCCVSPGRSSKTQTSQRLLLTNTPFVHCNWIYINYIDLHPLSSRNSRCQERNWRKRKRERTNFPYHQWWEAGN